MNAEEFLAGKVLLIDKPLKWSSFQAVNKLKYILKRKYDLPKKFLKFRHKLKNIRERLWLELLLHRMI